MRYRIEDIKTVANSTLLYVEVEFIETGRDRTVHYCDFAMQIYPETTYYSGPPIEPGDIDPDEVYIPDPNDYTTEETDVRQAIIDNIEVYLGKLERGGLGTRPFDARSPVLRRTKQDTDPLGLRGKPGVTDLIGRVRQRP